MTDKELEELEALEQEALNLQDGSEEETSESEEQEDDTSKEEESESHVESTEEEEESEENSSSSESNEEETHESASKEEQKNESFKLNVKGHDVEVDSIEELIRFANLGANSVITKPTEKSDSELLAEQYKLTTDDIALLIKAKNGDVNALSKLAKDSKIDTLEIDESKADSYTNDVQINRMSDIDRVATEIASDESLASEFRRLSQSVPQDFIDKITSSAENLADFARHVKSGLAQEIIPLAYARHLKGENFFNAYANEGWKRHEERQKNMDNKRDNKEGKRSQQDKQITEELQKHLNINNSRSDNKSRKGKSVDDIWNMSDEEILNLSL